MTSLFPPTIQNSAARLVRAAAGAGLCIATAETVTGGLLAAALTEVPGVSRVFERGFVLYHSNAKSSGLGVNPAIAAEYGAVSQPVTAALALGLENHSDADVGVAVTGYAGPTGGNDNDPVGTVYLAGFDRDGREVGRREVFTGDRLLVKLEAVGAALTLLEELVSGLVNG
jgi:PncC family amidohydrolase